MSEARAPSTCETNKDPVIISPSTSAPPAVSLGNKPVSHAWRSWLPPMLWIALIFFMSSDLFSSSHTGVWLQRAMRLLHVPLRHFGLLHIVVRKTGHFAGYFVLSVLFFRAWRASLPQRIRSFTPSAGLRAVRSSVAPLWTLQWSSLAIAASIVAAALDEYHQSFVPSRTASVHDVILDTMGAVFAQIIVMLLLLDRRREDNS